MIRVLSCIEQQHDLRLVALAAVICLLGCWTSLTLLSRGRIAGRWSLRSTCAAATVFGISVWALHFVAMLAYNAPSEIEYTIGATAASMSVAILGALAAFAALDVNLPSRIRGWVAGALLAAGIGGMHYLGVAAMRLSGLTMLDGSEVAVSVALCVVLTVIGMSTIERSQTVWRRCQATGWLTLAICTLHFSGMAALTILPGEARDVTGTVLGTSTLGFVIGTLTIAILVVCLAATMLDKHLSDRTLNELSRMRRLNNLTHEALFIHRDGRIVEVNTAGERLLDASASDIIGNPVSAMFSEGSMPALCRRERCAPAERLPEEMEIVAANGRLIMVELSCEPIDFMGRRATAMSLRDLTDRKRDEARIRHLARHDPLTGVFNRFSLHERLDAALEEVAHGKSTFAVLYFDLDRFKPVNDLHGHAAGDALLVAVVQRVRGELGIGDTLARVGGDEFVVVQSPDATPERAGSLAGRILAVLNEPFLVDGHTASIGASLGIAMHPCDGDTVEELLRAADTAMYRVKAEGKGSFRFFEAAMDAQLQARRHLEQELRDAVRLDQLVLHFQPMVNGTTGDLETFEALLRWEHPRRGRVPPLEFIPVAEETGLIGEIGQWVIETACREAARWPKPWRVSVNVSPAQFSNTDVCGIIADSLRRHRLSPGRFVVEITESVLIHDAAAAVAVLNRLRSTGIRLALDDFGTGFSSLSYLQMFRFDKIKIDKSFVQRLGDNDDAVTITRAIVNLGHNLGLHVTAEGVETAQQLYLLQSLGCDQIQGYLVGRPAPVDAYAEFERARTRATFMRREPQPDAA